MRIFIIVLSLSTLLGFAHFAWSEPWVANRYAQNCSACHSPSRRNVPLKDRRCTLACQGCHVNPAGGGMRNEYGVWNQQRWLRSYTSSTLRDKGTPAPLKYQKYGSQPKNIKTNATLKSYNQYIKNGPKLVVTKDVEYNPADHDKSDKQEFVTVRSEGEFLARVTEDDPWRLERRKTLFAGGDMRFFFIEQDGKESGLDLPDNRKQMWAPMMADIYLKGRPIREHLSLVVESRFVNNPIEGEVERFFSSNGSHVRSAYILIDDLPFASYVQYGLYKPLFGHATPDHESLAQEMQHRRPHSAVNTVDNPYDVVYKAFTIGSSPNVPFFNLSYIMPTDNDGSPAIFRQEEGIAATIGGRFVTYGASVKLSYWATKVKDEGGGGDLGRNMLSVSAGGFFFDRLVLNLDYTQIETEFDTNGGSDTGQVYTAEAKYRFWRENYFVVNYAQGSTARNLTEGDSSDFMVGVKSFLFAGSEVELLMIQREDRESNIISNRDILQLQAHLFF